MYQHCRMPCTSLSRETCTGVIPRPCRWGFWQWHLIVHGVRLGTGCCCSNQRSTWARSWEPPPGWFRMEHSSGQPGTRQCGCFSRRTAVCFGCWGWPEGPRSSWECSHLKKRGILYGLGLCSREWMHSNLLKSFSVSPVCVNSATCNPISV